MTESQLPYRDNKDYLVRELNILISQTSLGVTDPNGAGTYASELIEGIQGRGVPPPEGLVEVLQSIKLERCLSDENKTLLKRIKDTLTK